VKRCDDGHQEPFVSQRSAARAVIWIDGAIGRLVDELEVETRIRSGEGGCQLCHEELDGREAHGEVQFDGRGLPRLLFGPGGPICADCVEWVRWLATNRRASASFARRIGCSSRSAPRSAPSRPRRSSSGEVLRVRP
jgi:hypothetical protein